MHGRSRPKSLISASFVLSFQASARQAGACSGQKSPHVLLRAWNHLGRGTATLCREVEVQPDINVDLEDLEDARTALIRLSSDVDDASIQDIEGPPSAYGHAELANVTSAFCDAWHKSINRYLQDIGDVIDKLGDTIADYRENERRLSDSFSNEK